MSIQLILGNSGSGKTHYIYEKFIEEAGQNPERNYYIIVPEQFTLETQRDLVSMHPGHSIGNIDILSFQRLSYRIFEEMGAGDHVVLEDTGKNFIIRRIVEEQEGNLKILKGNLRRMGYIDEIKSFLSELMQYHVTPDTLLDMAEDADTPSLRLKLLDIHLIYTEFLKVAGEDYITAEGILEEVAGLVGQSKLLKGCHMVFDGFTGFTPVQNLLLKELMQVADCIYIPLTMDAQGDPFTVGSMQDLFYMSKKTGHSFRLMAQETGTELLEPIRLSGGDQHRFAQAPELYHLEQNLFRKHFKKCQIDPDHPQIHLRSLAQPKQELCYVASEIQQLVRSGDYRYSDFAVITGSVETYENQVEEVFDTYRVPLFFDATHNLVFHPFVECIRGLLQMVIEDFSYRSVIGFLRSGFTDISRDEIDLLENYLLASGIRGYGAYAKPWKRRTQNKYSDQELTSVNEIRDKLCKLIKGTYDSLNQKNITAGAMTYAIYDFLVEIQAGKRLADQEDAFTQAGDLVRAKENSQIYTTVMKIFEKFQKLLGDQVVTLKEYKELMEAGFTGAKLGVIPPKKDSVVFGDMERTRLNHVKVLFLVGANDGIIPAGSGEGGILSEMERQSLRQDWEDQLAFGAREKALVGNFYLYLKLTKPAHHLYISYFTAGTDGKSASAAFLVRSLQNMFTGLQVERIGHMNRYAQSHVARMENSEAAFDYFVQELRNIMDRQENLDQIDPTWLAIYQYYVNNKKGDLIDSLIDAAIYRNEDSVISRAVAESVYGKRLKSSISRLEKFAACAFAHYMQYGLNLRERRQYSFESIDMGNVFHDAIDIFAGEVMKRTEGFQSLTPEDRDDLSEYAMAQALSAVEEEALFDSHRSSYMAQRMKRVFSRTVHTVVDQIQAGKFEVAAHERPFESTVELDKDLGYMDFNGKIDRIDTYDDGERLQVRIVDYKSSQRELDLGAFYGGISLQLLVYLDQATKFIQEKNPRKQVYPAGVYYYGMVDPLQSLDQEKPTDQVEEDITKELRMQGLTNEATTVLQATEDIGAGATSKVVHLETKKDGSLGSRSQSATAGQLQDLMDYAQLQIREAGSLIADGHIETRPYKKDKKTGCDYCPYGSICGFDQHRAGYGYREIINMKNDDAMEVIGKRLHGEEVTDHEMDPGSGEGN